MPRASARMHKPRHSTERLDLQAIPQREADAVATVRIVNIGVKSKPAARSGGTWQIPGPVQPGQPLPPPPQVIYARPVQVAPPREKAYADSVRYDDGDAFSDSEYPRGLFDTPRERIAELQRRAGRALSGLQANLPTQRIEASRTWSKPSTRVMSVAVGVYTLALFLFALLSR